MDAWIAALASGLLHGLAILLALLAPPVTLSSPEGAAGGSRIDVTFIDRPSPVPSPPEAPAPARRPLPPRRPAPPPSASRLQAVEVERADAALPDEARTAEEPPAPTSASPRPAPVPPRHVRGQPPGMLPRQHAPVNAGPAPSPEADRGQGRRVATAEPNMEAGGFQVVYDLLGEARLRAWRDAGMTEISIPLPGIREYMVCPLETALKRGSGPCRLLHPDHPDMAGIGDAREVLTMHQVYRRGELVWRGPGPYR